MASKEQLQISYKVVLSFNEKKASANVQINNLRHADFTELRKRIDALEALLLMEERHDHQ